MAGKNAVKVANAKKAVAKAVKVGKVAARKSLSSEQFKQSARWGEAVMGAIISAETGEAVKGTNSVQALGQGKLMARDGKGEWQVTAGNQLKGNFAAFDGNNSALVTAAVLASDHPLDGALERNGLVRWAILHREKLCNNPADQKMVDAIMEAIYTRYPAAREAQAGNGRKPRGEKAQVANPNAMFA